MKRITISNEKFRGPVRSELCSILDLNDKWRELAAWLGYSIRDVEQIARIAGNRSPSDVLLEQWGQKAPTMPKLFIALSEIQHYQALMLLKDFVPEELHTLIYEGEENLDTKDNEDGTEAESESLSSSDTNNIVAQNESASKQLNSKLVGPRFKLMNQQEDQTLPPNVIDHGAYMKDMFQRMTEQKDIASAVTVNQPSAHTGLAISVPPACFVPPEVLNTTSNLPAFSGYAPLSPWLNSESYCKGILSQDECSRIHPSPSNSNELEENNALPESIVSTARIPSGMTSTSQSTSAPARRVLGSSLASKKLMLGAL